MKPGPIFNQDCTEFFVVNPPDKISGETVDVFVDSLAAAGVAALFSNINAQRANYDSAVRETYWYGYDPTGPDEQPYFVGYPKERLPVARPMIDAMLALVKQGVDFHARAIARCHAHGMEGWISLRMNDVHDVELSASPQLNTVWKTHPEWRRVPYRFERAFDRQLDYARPEVRAHYWVLIEEVLNRYDLDGLELDFMRFPYYFRIGHELEGGRILTAWLREVRALCAAARLGHPVKLAVRVPAEPETARQMGLDGADWAHEGLIDLLVATPFWETTDTALPIRLWRRLLEGTQVTLAAGLEILVRPYWEGSLSYQTPETSTGNALAALYEGADRAYLFNHFCDMPGQRTGMWNKADAERVFRAMSSVATLDRLSRRHVVTYRDTQAPGEVGNKLLPATGKLAIFRLHTGPRPAGRKVQVVLGFENESPRPALFKPPAVRVHAVLCPGIAQVQGTNAVYDVPGEALGDEIHTVEVESTDGQPFKIVWVEMSVAARE